MTLPNRIVVMGVAGSGKSTVAELLARRLGARFVEADDFHPSSNVEKMVSGHPLDDDDRWPWLRRLQLELAKEASVVIACSALRRSYRDLLRRAGHVRFVFLDVSATEAQRRLGVRSGHFMGPGMVAGQFEALERPDDEIDVIVLDATNDPDALAALAMHALQGGIESSDRTGPRPPLLSDGAVDREITSAELAGHLETVVTIAIDTGARRVLLVPPDHSRLHARAGEITATLFRRLTEIGCEVAVLPALGTHVAMTTDDCDALFGPTVPFGAVRRHDWRNNLVRLGEVSAAETAMLSGGSMNEPVPIETDALLLDSWDLVVSVGQVVPHEVIGMANFTKNLVIGLGGPSTIHRSHFLGATSDMETIMGRAESPVRDLVDAAFDRFLAPLIDVIWVLTVMEDTPGGVVQRGLFVGRGGSGESGGAAFRCAAELAVHCNVDVVEAPFTRVACWLDPTEFRTTWLANKAIYRTRMAIADGGELIVLAPGVERFGEDPAIDALIRRHGYRGTVATLAALGADPGLASNLAAAAHLIHGSSEDRFTVTYCTDPSSGGLRQDEVEAVGFAWRPLAGELARLGISPSDPSGPRIDAHGTAFDFIANPALGLWVTADRFR